MRLTRHANAFHNLHMRKTTHTKKSARLDWHRADIVAALHKVGWTIRKLSTHHGYADPTTLSHALDRPWPKGQKLIADALGLKPETIWPTRYCIVKSTTAPASGNALERLAA